MIGTNPKAAVNDDDAIAENLRLIHLQRAVDSQELENQRTESLWDPQCGCQEKPMVLTEDDIKFIKSRDFGMPSPFCPVHGEAVKAVLERMGLTIVTGEAIWHGADDGA
jgi:hypothetical protein